MDNEWKERMEQLVTLFEMDRDDGTPLYNDGDMRIGFKKKDLMDFISSELLSAREETKKSFKAEVLEILGGMKKGWKEIETEDLHSELTAQGASFALADLENKIKEL
jgi:hypothetical protein